MSPVIHLTFGVMRVVDLFYSLPDEVADPGEIPALQATTRFQPVEVGLDTFWINGGGVAFGGAHHAWHGRVSSRGHTIGGGGSDGGHGESDKSSRSKRITRPAESRRVNRAL